MTGWVVHKCRVRQSRHEDSQTHLPPSVTRKPGVNLRQQAREQWGGRRQWHRESPAQALPLQSARGTRPLTSEGINSILWFKLALYDGINGSDRIPVGESWWDKWRGLRGGPDSRLAFGYFGIQSTYHH